MAVLILCPLGGRYFLLGSKNIIEGPETIMGTCQWQQPALAKGYLHAVYV